GDLRGSQGNPSVIDQDQVSRPYVAGQAFVRGGATLDGALDVLDSDRELGAAVQLLLAVGEPAEPDLRTLKICEYTDRATGTFRSVSDAAQIPLMVGIVTMTHVEPGDIHSCGDHLR